MGVTLNLKLLEFLKKKKKTQLFSIFSAHHCETLLPPSPPPPMSVTPPVFLCASYKPTPASLLPGPSLPV